MRSKYAPSAAARRKVGVGIAAGRILERLVGRRDDFDKPEERALFGVSASYILAAISLLSSIIIRARCLDA